VNLFARSVVQFLSRKSKRTRGVDEAYFLRQAASPQEKQAWRELSTHRRSDPLLALAMIEYWADVNRFSVLLDVFRDANEHLLPVLRSTDRSNQLVVNVFNELMVRLVGRRDFASNPGGIRQTVTSDYVNRFMVLWRSHTRFFLDRFVELRSGPPGDDDLCPLDCQPLGDGEADTTGRSGDERSLT
jgi:hypothetical protein